VTHIKKALDGTQGRNGCSSSGRWAALERPTSTTLLSPTSVEGEECTGNGWLMGRWAVDAVLKVADFRPRQGMLHCFSKTAVLLHSTFYTPVDDLRLQEPPRIPFESMRRRRSGMPQQSS